MMSSLGDILLEKCYLCTGLHMNAFIYTDKFTASDVSLFFYLMRSWRYVHIDRALPYSFE